MGISRYFQSGSWFSTTPGYWEPSHAYNMRPSSRHRQRSRSARKGLGRRPMCWWWRSISQTWRLGPVNSICRWRRWQIPPCFVRCCKVSCLPNSSSGGSSVRLHRPGSGAGANGSIRKVCVVVCVGAATAVKDTRTIKYDITENINNNRCTPIKSNIHKSVNIRGPENKAQSLRLVLSPNLTSEFMRLQISRYSLGAIRQVSFNIFICQPVRHFGTLLCSIWHFASETTTQLHFPVTSCPTLDDQCFTITLHGRWQAQFSTFLHLLQLHTKYKGKVIKWDSA